MNVGHIHHLAVSFWHVRLCQWIVRTVDGPVVHLPFQGSGCHKAIAIGQREKLDGWSVKGPGWWSDPSCRLAVVTFPTSNFFRTQLSLHRHRKVHLTWAFPVLQVQGCFLFRMIANCFWSRCRDSERWAFGGFEAKRKLLSFQKDWAIRKIVRLFLNELDSFVEFVENTLSSYEGEESLFKGWVNIAQMRNPSKSLDQLKFNKKLFIIGRFRIFIVSKGTMRGKKVNLRSNFQLKDLRSIKIIIYTISLNWKWNKTR